MISGFSAGRFNSSQIVFAFSDVDSARWPDPEELIASLDALRDAHARDSHA